MFGWMGKRCKRQPVFCEFPLYWVFEFGLCSNYPTQFSNCFLPSIRNYQPPPTLPTFCVVWFSARSISLCAMFQLCIPPFLLLHVFFFYRCAPLRFYVLFAILLCIPLSQASTRNRYTHSSCRGRDWWELCRNSWRSEYGLFDRHITAHWSGSYASREGIVQGDLLYTMFLGPLLIWGSADWSGSWNRW